MRSKFLFIILNLIIINTFGQVSFEKGYFIGNDNKRVDCFIKNTDWDDNPIDFKYKLTDTDEPKRGDLSSAREFGILNVVKFIRADVKIDRSTRGFSNYSDLKEPVWSDEQLFLRVLLEGKASLYCYVQADLRFYFYCVNNNPIRQLVQKDYKLNTTDANYFDKQNSNVISTNNEFRLQLWNDVRCENATINSVETLPYKQNELVNYFKKYNSCVDSEIESYLYKQKREYLHLRFTPGLNFSSMTLSSYAIKFDPKVSLRVGLDAEIILPFNKNKWGLVFEPTYNSFNSEGESSIGKLSIAYNYIEFPFGLRYYGFINNNLKLFVNGFMIPGYITTFNNTIDFESPGSGSIKLGYFRSIHNYAIGSGIDYKKLSVEIRYYTLQNPSFTNSTITSDYKRLAFIFGLKII